VVAAGMKLAVVRYSEPATMAIAWFLAAGVAGYVLGLVIFRWLIQGGRLSIRLLVAILVLPSAFVGLAVSPIAQLIVLVAILIVGTLIDSALG